MGDTTSILLGSFAGMNFFDSFWMKGRPGIFFGVELGAPGICTCGWCGALRREEFLPPFAFSNCSLMRKTTLEQSIMTNF